jgi:hypothetical protein
MNNETVFTPDTKTLVQWEKDRDGLSQEVSEQVEKYFRRVFSKIESTVKEYTPEIKKAQE